MTPGCNVYRTIAEEEISGFTEFAAPALFPIYAMSMAACESLRMYSVYRGSAKILDIQDYVSDL